MSWSSSPFPSSTVGTGELSTGVAEFRFRNLGAGVLLARLEFGVPDLCEEGVPSTLSLSSRRFLAAGFLIVLAVPFLSILVLDFGAVRFLFVRVGLDAAGVLRDGVDASAEDAR